MSSRSHTVSTPHGDVPVTLTESGAGGRSVLLLHGGAGPDSVTGFGVASTLGVGRDAFLGALRNGARAPFSGGKAEVPDFDAARYLGEKGLRSLDRLTKLAPWPVNYIDPAPAIALRVVELLGPAANSRTGTPRAMFTSGRGPQAVLARFGIAAQPAAIIEAH